MNNTSIFLPTRKGSKRIVHKNTREFAGIEGGLLRVKLAQLHNVKYCDEIILSTNDELSIEIANRYFKDSDKLRIVWRPEELAQDQTDLTDLIDYAAGICRNDHILWTHVTSPMVDGADYDRAIHKYFQSLSADFDSLMSVNPLRNFLWDNEKREIVNRDQGSPGWPRTQDLKVFYEIDSAIFISSVENYIVTKNRVGNNPFLFELGFPKSLDVDWQKDFVLAESVYKERAIFKL